MVLQTYLFLIILARGLGYPTVESIKEHGSSNSTSECEYRGQLYKHGEEVATTESCLACSCNHGSLLCYLRVCPQVPDPPPAGCVVVYKNKHCCPHLVCGSGQIVHELEARTASNVSIQYEGPGCVINGTLYAEGSALASSSLCEYCYCIQSKQKCVQPQCRLPLHQECSPVYKTNSCCPTHYECKNTTQKTKIKLGKKPKERACLINGTVYPDGDQIKTDGSLCKSCYCMRGKAQCVPVKCSMPVEGCEPVYALGRCCPVSYNCSREEPATLETKKTKILNSRKSNKLSSINYELKNETTNEIDKEIIDQTDQDNKTNVENISTTTEFPDTTTYFSTIYDTTFVETTETTLSLEHTTLLETTSNVATEMTTSIPETTTFYNDSNLIIEPKNSVDYKDRDEVILSRGNVVNTTDDLADPIVKSVETLTQNTTLSDDDYVYDYDEQSLPPSLPNLKIIPFVAADAVVKEKAPTPMYSEKEIKRVDEERPVYYKEARPNYFSPPIETEGGFLPREPPMIDGAYYFANRQDESELRESSAEHGPSLTTPSILNNELCMSDGRDYRHGELLSEIGACISCACFYGEIICQEPNCPAVKEGCERLAELEENSCCGRVYCGNNSEESPTVVVAVMEPSNTPPIMNGVVPPITIADIIDVTPNPFRDVIRTERAPDLSSLTSSLPLHYHTKKKPVTVAYKDQVVNYFPEYQITTSRDEKQSTTSLQINPVYYSTQPYQLTTESMNISEDSDNHITTDTSKLTEETSETPFITTDNFVRTSIGPVFLETTSPIITTISSIKTTKRRPTRRPLISLRPKTTKKTTTSSPTTVSESSFIDEFLKGFLQYEQTSTFRPTTTNKQFKQKYSAKIKPVSTTMRPTTSTTTEVAVTEELNVAEVSEKVNAENREDIITIPTKSTSEPLFPEGSISFENVLNLLFNNEPTTTTPPVTTTLRPKYKATRKPLRKPTTKRTLNLTEKTTEKPKIPTTTTSTTSSTTSTITEEVPSKVSFVTEEDTGFPKINILQQGNQKTSNSKIPHKSKSSITVNIEQPKNQRNDLRGILKLAGCNIYGRMYRVGKIITELSGPCLECMCTDMGVQCASLTC